MRIETERLSLRLPTPDDVERAGELVGDPEVMRFLGGKVVPHHAWSAVVEAWLMRWEANGMGPFMVERRDDGRFVGRTGIMVWDRRTWTHGTFATAGSFAQPELGWALVRAAWGNGYATEAARAVRDWAVGEQGVAHLVSVIAPDNHRSRGVAVRLGAVRGETVSLFDSGDAVVWRYPAA